MTYEKYGKFAMAMAVSCATLPSSVPLLYSGQEIPNKKRLAFFEKDTLQTNGIYLLKNFYATLFLFRKWYPLFKNIKREFHFLSSPERIISYMTKDKEHAMMVILNFSDYDFSGEIFSENLTGTYNDLFSKEEIILNGYVSVNVSSAGFKILYKA